MSQSYVTSANFGGSRTGLAGRVGYIPAGGSRTTGGVAESPAGSGIYVATATLADGFSGTIAWDTGDGDTVSGLLNLVAGGTGYTNGTGYALAASGGGGTGFAGTFDVVNGSVTNPIVTNRGTGFSAPPTLSFPGAGSGTGASATASLTKVRYSSDTVNSAGTVTLPSPAPTGYGPVGTGSVAVNQDYPTTGNLAFKTAGGQGIGGAIVLSYLASEYAAGPNAATIRGQTITLDSGAWANVISLDPGAYTLVFKAEGYETTLVNLNVS